MRHLISVTSIAPEDTECTVKTIIFSGIRSSVIKKTVTCGRRGPIHESSFSVYIYIYVYDNYERIINENA